MPRKLRDWPGGWIEAYLQYTQGTESPESFHLWTGLGTIAAAAQRKIWLRSGRLKIHSNMFITLVGPSGGPRKTTAMNFGRDLLLSSRDYGAKVELAPKKASAAAIITRMAGLSEQEHQSLTAYAGELGTLLGNNSVEVSDLLTDLWDCDANFDKLTIGRGAENVVAPWFNVVAGTTPVWLADNLPKTATDGGFVSRGIYVYEEAKAARVPRPEINEDQAKLEPALVHDLAEINFLRGEMTFTDEGGDYFDRWYMDPKNFMPKYGNRMDSFYERKHVHVQKVAMALSLSRDDSLRLDETVIRTAIALVEDVEKGMAPSFAGVGRNEMSLDQERIKRQIHAKGESGIPYKAILASHIHSLDKTRIDAVLHTLEMMGEIYCDKGRTYFSRRAG